MTHCTRLMMEGYLRKRLLTLCSLQPLKASHRRIVWGVGGGGEHGASEVTAVEIDSLLPRFLELVFHNSVLQGEFYKVCSRMAVLWRGCTFIFIRTMLIPKQLNEGTDLLVHRHQKNHFHVKVLIFSLVSKVWFSVGITLVITGMKHSTKAGIPRFIGRAGSYLPWIISSCFDSKSSLKNLKLGYRIFTGGKNNNRRNGMAQVKFAILEILHLNYGKEEHIFKGSKKNLIDYTQT